MSLLIALQSHTLNLVMSAAAKKSSLETRVEAFRELVREAISKAQEQGKTLKPYDGSVGLQWPALVATGKSAKRYTLRLSCSVLGGETSHYSWSGRSWRSVFAHAAEDVATWTEMMGEGDDK